VNSQPDLIFQAMLPEQIKGQTTKHNQDRSISGPTVDQLLESWTMFM